jgi:hypothetical protein
MLQGGVEGLNVRCSIRGRAVTVRHMKTYRRRRGIAHSFLTSAADKTFSGDIWGKQRYNSTHS